MSNSGLGLATWLARLSLGAAIGDGGGVLLLVLYALAGVLWIDLGLGFGDALVG